MGTDELYLAKHPIRVVTAAALFDGHDAAINLMRRILQAQGAEVIHLGHNRSVDEVVTAAIEEDAHAVAISSYQGGHVEYFEYLMAQLAARGADHIAVFGGGGGVIVADEIAYLQSIGVDRIFSPQDGQAMGLAAMINVIIERADEIAGVRRPADVSALLAGDRSALPVAISRIEDATIDADDLDRIRAAALASPGVVLGVTGTGGSGKSSLTDELIRRLRIDQGNRLHTAVIAVDPTRRRTGGALLGDRIRMNSLGDTVYFRSVATRDARTEIPDALPDLVAASRAAGFDLVIIETPGIGQGDAAIEDIADLSLYVMTADFGAPSQLEKIAMLDVADVVAINKYERRGSEDARRDVGRQLLRNREDFGLGWSDMPVFGTSAASFDDDGVSALYQQLRDELGERGLPVQPGMLAPVSAKVSSGVWTPVPPHRVRYLAEIATAVRDYHLDTERQMELARERQLVRTARPSLAARPDGETVLAALEEMSQTAEHAMDARTLAALREWPAVVAEYRDPDRLRSTLSGTAVPRVAVPRVGDDGELVRYLRSENRPGVFPFTAGVFAFKRSEEEPARMFAGEGDPFRTNERFRVLSKDQPATRLSTAFDPVTLYGRDPDEPPDIYGKIGTSGVSIATIEDMKVLYSGFDLCAPSTSVSMTINGPAPTVLAFFLNTAIDQQVEAFRGEAGREPTADEARDIRARVLQNVRGTVQADILKEDQGQNTCIFSTEFSLRMMTDIQEWFVANQVRHFYSVSISGYHIAEAGANPITQLAFTLANGFTCVESFLARGMGIDEFAPNLSFFFSNGMDAEYTVLGRVARRIWAIAMRERYGANDRSQRLKYHVQTSGRSLHAQEMSFNDIRTTLQALTALNDNCNSLHTNAYDEAVTTPSEESVRRALAIQLIINREYGLAMNENPLQGAYIVDELTDLVEAAVLAEFDRLTERGGVLGAMETGYQRGRIQDESMEYEQRKHDGRLPIIGVNQFVNPLGETPPVVQLARGTEAEKRGQIERTAAFRRAHQTEAEAALAELKAVVNGTGNVFETLMAAARVCSLGQITEAFFEVGGAFRRTV